MLSGRLPFETGVRDNVGFTVKAGERLLPQMLRDRGYATGGVVSAFVLRKETGIGQGFDFFDGEMPPASRRAVDRAGAARRRRVGADRRALARHRSASSRAFLFLHLVRAAQAVRAARALRRVRAVRRRDRLQPTRSSAGSCKYLKSHQLYDRSTIVLLSDHGEGLGDHGEQEHGLFVYDEAIHVPLIIKQEGNAGAGRRVADLVQHIDLVPTILDLVKAPVPGSLRGRSLKPLLEGTGQAAAAAGLLGGAVRALSLRLERADRADRRALPLHQGAARGAVRPAARSARAHNIAGDRPQPRAGAARRARSPGRRRDDSAPAAGLGRCARAAAGARLRRRAQRRAGAAGRDAARSEGQDARFSRATAPRSTSPASGEWPQAIALLQQILARGPGDGRRLEPARRVRRAARSRSIWRSTPTSTTSR